MNLQEMRTFIGDYIGETITGFRTTAQLNNWCNAVYRKITRARLDWRWNNVTKTTSLVAGQTAYKLPDDCLSIVVLKIDGEIWRGIKLHDIPYYSGHYFYILGTDQGDHYVHLLEEPASNGDNNMEMIYLYTPPPLTDDADLPRFHEIFHDIIPTFVCYLALRKEDDPTKEEFLKEYSDGMKRLVAWDQQFHESGDRAGDRLVSYDQATGAESYRDNY